MTQTLQELQPSVELLTTTEQLQALQETWEELLAVTPAGSGFQSAGWLIQCWIHLRRPGDSLFVSVVKRDSQVVAIFPTQLSGDGLLSFVGKRVSNYSGPVYRPDGLVDAVSAWTSHLAGAPAVRAVDLSGLREDSPFLHAMRTHTLPGLAGPSLVKTNVCPEAELSQGWEQLYHRHRRKHRSSWRRQERRLSALGDLRFVETGDPEEVRSAMPRLAELYRSRWEGQRVSGGPTEELEAFHTEAAGEAARAGHVALGQLVLDDEIIALSYGIRSGGVTTSYFVAYDENFGIYSVGLLLLLRILEAAARRGDPLYDFSLGHADYKGMWATRERGVFRLLWGRRRRPKTLWTRAWVAARSVPVLQRAKQEGIGAVLGRPPQERPKPDVPGLRAGDIRSWSLYRIAPGATEGAVLRPGRYHEMRRLLSPRLLALAIERSARSDELQLVEAGGSIAGVIWLAAGGRRALVLGELLEVAEDEAVHYHPVAATGTTLRDLVLELSPERPCIVASPEPLAPDPRIERLGSYPADAAFRRPTD